MSALPPQALSNQAILAMCGADAFARGLRYAREGRVSAIDVDPGQRTISGRVIGSHRSSYATSVDLAHSPSNSSPVHRGRCSCPVALDCKHAAALLIVARSSTEVVEQLRAAEWERVLRNVVNAPEPVPASEPLAVEFSVDLLPAYGDRQPPATLRMRPLHRGGKGRWIRSGLSWEDLEQRGPAYRRDHLDVLTHLRALVRGSARYFYPRTSWIDLEQVGAGLWSALQRASTAGVALIGPDGAPVIVGQEDAEVVLDLARRPDGSVQVSAELFGDGRAVEAEVLGLLGQPAHGAFWIGTSDRGPRTLTLAALRREVESALGDLLRGGRPVVVPGTEEARLLEEYLPALRRRAAVRSSDGSIPLPEPWRARLRCTVGYRPGHLVRLDWAVVYQAGDRHQVYALDDPVRDGAVRDQAEERRLVDALELPYERLPRLRGDDGDLAPHALFGGRDAVVVSTELLSWLDERGVETVVEGEVVDYREVADEPTIELSAVPDPGGSDWFDLRVKVSVAGEVIDFEQLFVALTLGDEVLITDSGVCVPLDRPQLAALRDLITEARALREPHPAHGSEQRISTAQASLWSELVALGVVVEQTAEWAAAVRGLTDATGIEALEPPPSLKATLRPYQVEGFRWLAFLDRHRLGGILADDMGLGKTLQTLAVICRARQRAPDDPPFLVVAPTSVVSNWEREVERFAPTLRVVSLTESGRKRKVSLAEVVAGADVVVTSYALLRIDIEALAAQQWRGLVLDEAQFVKNRSTKTYRAVRRLSAPLRVAITGTPLENSLMDLWSLLSIVAPGLFPDPERFSQHYRLPIERTGDPATLDRLRRRVRPLMLRRTKEAVAAELPPKQEQVVQVVLQPRHLRVYQTHLQRERQKVLGLVDEMDKNRFTILRSLTLLRQLALDPSLVDPAHAGVPATKLDLLVDQLAELVLEGHRALVFSQFTGVLGHVRERLSDRIPYAYLDGSTRDRAAAIDMFTSGQVPVFLISLKAGGFGLNLVEADYCFLLDPWWNPAAEAQAVDRTHRIGQDKTVMVYRLVAKDTIEEKVMELKARKEVLVDAVLGGDTLADASLTAEDIRSLLAG